MVPLTGGTIIPPFTALLSMLKSPFHPCLCSTCSCHPYSTCTHLFVALILIVKAEISGPGSFPNRTCSSSVAGAPELYFRLNSCRLKWSLPPTVSSHSLPPCWVSVLLLLLCYLHTLKVAPAPAESLEDPISDLSPLIQQRLLISWLGLFCLF